MKWMIYKHTNKINGKVYIGQTRKSNPEYRWKEGRGYLYSGDTYFARAIRKYKWSNFSHSIIEQNISTQELANKRESYWILKYKSYVGFEDSNGYNMTLGGEFASINQQRKVICIETQIIYPNIHIAAENVGCDPTAICAVCKGRVNYIGGYHWAYESDKNRRKKLSKFIGRPPISKKRKVICIETQEIFESITQAESKTSSDISGCLSGKQISAIGYHWAYLDDSKTIAKFKKYVGMPKTNRYYARKILCIETNQMFNSLKDISSKNGLNGNSVWLCLNKRPESTSCGYHWAYADDQKRIERLSEFKDSPKYGLEKVVCYELKKTFENYKDAGKQLKIQYSLIRKAMTNPKFTAGGYHWFTEQQYMNGSKPIKKDIINSRKVYCVETQKIYDSITIAEKETGCSNISGCCRNHKYTSKKLHWCYLEDKDKYKFIKKKKSWNAHRIINMETKKEYDAISDVLCEFSNISRSTLFRALKSTNKTAGGYHWKYID